MIYEEYYELKQKPIDLKLAADGSNSFKKVYHFHPGIEIIYVHEGHGQIIIEQNVYPISPGTLIFVRPFQPHFLQMNITESNRYVRSLIKYEPDFFLAYLKPFPILDQFHNYLCHAPVITQIQKFLDLNFFLRKYAEQFKKRIDSGVNLIERNTIFLLAFYQFIQPLWNHYSSISPSTFGDDPTIVQIIKWIDKNFHQEFNLNALAKIIHLSPNHICYLFKKSTGYTITDFLTVRRMKHAATLLKTSTLAVHEIGQRCGYSNHSYFCQVFKKNIGMTPSQYRVI